MIDFSDESALLEAIKQGDDRAFEYLFKSYYPRLRAYAIRFVENDETAADIIQECFLKFWEKRALLSAVAITSLLFAMVRNSCLNYLKHRCIVEKHEIQYLSHIEGDERLYHTDFALDAESSLLFDELQQQINLVIDQLPDRCRQVFLLSRFKGFKNREIADQLHISTTAVEKHISKALFCFSKHFKEQYPVDIYITVLAWVILNHK